jgi:hypothetical protein
VAVNRDVQTTPTAQQAAERRLGIVGRASLGAAVMLVVQYGLGIGVNLYIAVPTGGSAGSTVGRAFSNGPLLAAHAVLGVLLVLTAVSLVVRAVLARQRVIIVLASLGLLAILAAAGNGVSFLHSGADGESLGMAIATGVALLCYIGILFAAGFRARPGSD